MNNKNKKEKIKLLNVLKEILYYAGEPIVEDKKVDKVKCLGTRVKRKQVV